MELQNIVFERGEPVSLTCTISNLSTLQGFTSTMNIYNYENGNLLHELDGTINGLDIEFELDSASNDLITNKYMYEVILTEEATSNKFVVAKGFIIIE